MKPEPKRCHFCKIVLSTSKYSTMSYRTDGYCSARCKRRDPLRQEREINEACEQENSELAQKYADSND